MLLMMGGDTTRNMYSSFPEINKLCNFASCWKYIKRNILTMHGPLNVNHCIVLNTTYSGFLINHPRTEDSKNVAKYTTNKHNQIPFSTP